MAGGGATGRAKWQADWGYGQFNRQLVAGAIMLAQELEVLLVNGGSADGWARREPGA